MSLANPVSAVAVTTGAELLVKLLLNTAQIGLRQAGQPAQGAGDHREPVPGPPRQLPGRGARLPDRQEPGGALLKSQDPSATFFGWHLLMLALPFC